MKVFGVPLSPPTQVAVLAAYQLDLELTLQPLDFSKGEHKTPEFLAKNPRG